MYGVKEWIVFIWFRLGQVAGSCEQGNEPSGSIKSWEFLNCVPPCKAECLHLAFTHDN